jgi:hypothetical protein
VRTLTYVLFAVGGVFLAVGAVVFAIRFDEPYGPSLLHMYAAGVGIAILVIGLIVKTIADRSGGKKKEPAHE